MLTPPTPPVQYAKDKAVYDCAVKYLASLENLKTCITTVTLPGGISPVFDGNAEHANAVQDAVAAASPRLTRGRQVALHLLTRLLVEGYTGTNPGSPAPEGMAIVPSDVPGYLAFEAQLTAAFAGISALTYTVEDVPSSE